MKSLVVTFFFTCTLLTPISLAQRGGPPHGGPPFPGGAHGGAMRPSMHPDEFHSHSDFHGEHTVGTLIPPWAYDYGYGYGYGSPFADFGYAPPCTCPEHPQPQVIMVAQPERPPDPPRSAIHTYTWPGQPARTPAVFSLAMKNSDVHSAIAVWVQDGIVNYLDENGKARSESLAAIDLEATRSLNKEKLLNLPLPKGTPSQSAAGSLRSGQPAAARE